MIRALVTAAVGVLIFVTAQMVALPLGAYTLPLLIFFTLVVTLSVVRLQRRELTALGKIDELREQIEVSRTNTRRFLIVVVVAGAADLLLWWVNTYAASILGLGLFVFAICYLVSRIPAAIRFGKEQFAEQVKREINPAHYDK